MKYTIIIEEGSTKATVEGKLNPGLGEEDTGLVMAVAARALRSMLEGQLDPNRVIDVMPGSGD